MLYEINEELARRSHDMMSMRDYEAGSATKQYRMQCEKAEKIYSKVVDDCKTEAQKEHAAELLDKYCRTLAYAINEENRIGCQCPSVLVSGAANFPTRKKEKQVAAWDANRSNFEKAEHILYVLRGVASQGIQSNDPEAIDALKFQLENLKAEHERMKRINAYHRKNKTLEGCPDLTERQAKELQESMDKWIYHIPFPSYSLQSSNAKMKRIQERIESLENVKEKGSAEQEYDGFKYIENSEAMRIQFIFDGKPDAEIRTILKSNGFRWAPSQGAWQRQLTDNGKRAAKEVIKELSNQD